jgi:hypothetical protein
MMREMTNSRIFDVEKLGSAYCLDDRCGYHLPAYHWIQPRLPLEPVEWGPGGSCEPAPLRRIQWGV